MGPRPISAVVLCFLGLALIVTPVEAQSDPCCPTGDYFGEVLARFHVGTPISRVEEIVAELGAQITSLTDGLFGPFAVLCVPIGEESAFVALLEGYVEVRVTSRSGVGCVPIYPECECCICGLECPPGLPPCDPDCELDSDIDTFADRCDTCTDTDDDGFGDPDFDVSFTECDVDNCPDVSNPDQADLDSDGEGDVCDGGLTICHSPPGNPARAHTITIANPAWPAHMQHGDVPGICQAQEGRRRGRDRPPVNPRISRPKKIQETKPRLESKPQ